MAEEQLRQRIQWLTDALSACRDHAQRERLIGQLLDTQDQLMVSQAGAAADGVADWKRKRVNYFGIGLGRCPRFGLCPCAEGASVQVASD